MKKRVLVIIMPLIFFLSCQKENDPSYETLMNYQFYFNNPNNIRLFAGESMPDSVELATTTYYYPTRLDSLRVVFSALRGEGTITPSTTLTNLYGRTKTHWQLGNKSCLQTLRASVFLPSGKFVTYADLYAYGFRTGQWDRVTEGYEASMTWLAADTVNDVTFMITNSTLYKQGLRYYSWIPVTNSNIIYPRTIQTDTSRVFYITTWSGELYRSDNHGETWALCTKPYEDHPYYFYMHISNDNRMWAFKFDLPTRYSDDGGMTWVTAGEEVSKHGFGWIYRLSNGWLVFHGSDCCSLYRSEDDGQTWVKITTGPPGYTYSVFVNDRDEIFVISHIFGVSVYKSTDMGATFNLAVSVGPQWTTTMEKNIFTRFGKWYYIIIPGYGIIKSDDLVTYNPNFCINSELRDLFIDHNGILIAREHNVQAVNYFREN